MSTMMSLPSSTPAAAAPAQPANGQQPAANAPTGMPSASAAPFAQWLVQADGAAANGANAATAGASAAAPVTADAALASNAAAGLPPAFQAALPTTMPVLAAAATGAPAPAVAGKDGKDSKPAAADGNKDQDSAALQDGTMLPAMAMPLMPLSPMQIVQAVQSFQAHAGAAMPATGQDNTRPAAERKEAPAGLAGLGAIGMPAAAQDAGRHDDNRRADIALAQLPLQPAQAARGNDSAVHLAVQAAATNMNAGANNATANPDAGAAAQDGGSAAAPASATPAAGAGAVAAAPAPGQPAADTVKLAGPPTAWRQSLQEALGDRLHVQVGKNVEQAVIRLEPPQLGRIDIAIRHSNGTLEVNISATNGEVLRQLQTVSDNLRTDLAARQYTEVAVSVTAAPKNSGASPFNDQQQHAQQQQQQGRRQGRDEQEPGRALAEASNPASVFSLGGRDA